MPKIDLDEIKYTFVCRMDDEKPMTIEDILREYPALVSSRSDFDEIFDFALTAIHLENRMRRMEAEEKLNPPTPEQEEKSRQMIERIMKRFEAELALRREKELNLPDTTT